MKILSQMYPWTTKPLLNFGGNLDPESEIRSNSRRTYAVSDCSCLHYSQQVHNLISSQHSENQAIGLENRGKL